MRRGVITSDVHLDVGKDLHPAYRLVKKFVSEWEPDFTVDLGDWMGFDYLAKFNQDDLKMLSTASLREDFDHAKQELDFWCSFGKRYMVKGNHDERTDRVAAKAPFLSADLNWAENLGLRDRGVDWYDVVERPLKLGGLTFIHGWYTNKYHAQKHLDAVGGSVVYGHTHRSQFFGKRGFQDDEHVGAWGLGTLGELQPDWQKGTHTGWDHSFAVIYLDEMTGKFWLYPIFLHDYTLTWEGYTWTLNKN